MFITYDRQTPDSIRTGDTVMDSRGRTFTANGIPEMHLGDWHVNGWDEIGNLRAYTIDGGTLVTVSYNEEDYNAG